MVSHFGAMQAQDYAMAKWGIGVRLPGIIDTDVEKALDTAEILRTHILRPTWHFVAAEDIHWMLSLTAKNVRRLMGTNDRKLGLDEVIFTKSLKLIENALRDGNHLTRPELMEILERGGISTSENRSTHIMMAAELEGLVASGMRKGKEHSYALLDERVKKPRKLTRDEAVAQLAETYFTSHGPATVKDYMWWSGLSAADAKAGLGANEKKLEKVQIDGKEYWFSEEIKDSHKKSVCLLPAFDEFLIGYTDRSAVIDPKFHQHAFTFNGIFKPILVLDGQVCGTWKRTIKKDTVKIEIGFFSKVATSRRPEIRFEAERFGRFLKKSLELET